MPLLIVICSNCNKPLLDQRDHVNVIKCRFCGELNELNITNDYYVNEDDDELFERIHEDCEEDDEEYYDDEEEDTDIW